MLTLTECKARRVKQCNSQKIWTETTSLTSCLRQILPSFFFLWMTPVQCKARLPLDYKLVGAERLRVSRHCIFLPSAFPTHSGGIRAGLGAAGTKDRRKASSRETAGLHPAIPALPALRTSKGKKNFVKLSSGMTALGKGAQKQREILGIWSWLWFCSPKWTDPPAARPCPVLHFPAADFSLLRWSHSRAGQLGELAFFAFFGFNVLRINQYKEHFPLWKSSNLFPVSASMLSAWISA